MPRYDYRCTSCGTVFESIHGMREHPQMFCPDCGAPAERVFDVSGIVLKGSGFYNTDQRGKKGATSATTGHTDHESSDGQQSSAAQEKTTSTEKPASKPAEGTTKKSEAKAAAVAE